jgi:Protein of unknown function (DUF1460)
MKSTPSTRRATCLLGCLSILAMSAGCHHAAADTTPLYTLKPAQIDQVLRQQRPATPLDERIIRLAQRNLDQPYEIYLLGEAPFESTDPQPVYCLEKSDCVVFVEHTLAMAHTQTFGDFLKLLQRIRYKDGVVGVKTRNHYTEADWNPNNAWLATDLTRDLAADNAVAFSQTVNRSAFFKSRYKLETDIPNQKIDDAYIPYQAIEGVKGKLRSGDVVQFLKGTSADSVWVHHLGFVRVMPDGDVRLIHSTSPKVIEESIDTYIERATRDLARLDADKKPRHRGFKFLRPNPDAMARLKAIDGVDAPRVTLPGDSPTTWDAFVAQVMTGK